MDLYNNCTYNLFIQIYSCLGLVLCHLTRLCEIMPILQFGPVILKMQIYSIGKYKSRGYERPKHLLPENV